jgi:glycosyltransferase involved in cell wall biosynthesis
MFATARYACANATSIIGVTDPFVEWGVKRGRRSRLPLDRSFPFSYDTTPLPTSESEAGAAFWNAKGVVSDSSVFTICFFGTLGKSVEMEPVIAAARILDRERKPVRFVLCGTGDDLERHRAAARDLPNVQFPGWANAAQIRTLMARSDLGLNPQVNRFDFAANISNKPIEYLSAGLPVLTSLTRGVLPDFLKQNRCGLSYEPTDPEALARALARLAEDSSEVKRMKSAAQAAFERNFTVEKVYGAMTDHLETVVRQYRRGQAAQTYLA